MSKTYKGKSLRKGGGGQFLKLEDVLKRKGYSEKSAGAIAANAGREKYGKQEFQNMAETGLKRMWRNHK